MNTTVTNADVIKALEDFCATKLANGKPKYPTFKKAAEALKITGAQLSTTLSGKSNVIPSRILKKFGLASEIVYVVKDPKKMPALAAATPKPAKKAAAPAAKKVAKTAISGRRGTAPDRRGTVAPDRREVTAPALHPAVIDVTARD